MQEIWTKIAFWLACGSAVIILFSIAASQILLGGAILAILLSRQRIRMPRVWLPLALFLLGTVISLLASGHILAGMPQVRKLYVYTMLIVVFTVIRSVGEARNLMLAWCGAAGVTSLIGIAQFIEKWREARALHRDFYGYYLDSRITGAMSHWMTFSGQEMLVFIILIAFLLFGRLKDRRLLAGMCIAAIAMGAALLLTDTRSVWIAAFVALLYLTWSRKKVLALAIPVLALLALAAGPSWLRERADSIVHPQAGVDSNGFRFVVWRTGWEMIKAHPMLGLGPEQVHQQFYAWLPADIPRPLPPGYYGHLHSIYVHYAAERGVPATLMLVWMLGMILYDCARGLRRIPRGIREDTRFLLHATIACVLAIAVEGFAELNLGDSEVLTMFLVITACGYVAVEDSGHVAARA
jgi:hypothetical protein